MSAHVVKGSDGQTNVLLALISIERYEDIIIT